LFLGLFVFRIFSKRSFRFKREKEKRGANDATELNTVQLLALAWTTVQELMQTIIRRLSVTHFTEQTKTSHQTLRGERTIGRRKI